MSQNLAKPIGKVTPLIKKTESNVKVYREPRTPVAKDFPSRVIIDTPDSRIEGTLVNVSQFGAKIASPSIEEYLDTNYSVPKVSLYLRDLLIFEGPATVTYVTEENGEQQLGMALGGFGMDMDKVKAVISADQTFIDLQRTKSILDLAKLIQPEFKVLVADFNTVIQDIRHFLNSEEAKIQERNLDNRFKKRFEENVIEVALSLYRDDFHKLFSQFSQLIANMSEEERSLHKTYFRTNFIDLIERTPFIRRAFEKPLGYAGDYGLMLMFYDYEDLGENLFDRFFHRYACNEPSSLANKNRVEFLSQQLMEHYKRTKEQGHNQFGVASVACGPAQEIQLFVEMLPDDNPLPVHIVLLDQEQRALQHVHSRLRPQLEKKNVKLTLFQEDAVLGFIKKRAFTKMLDGFDVIVSAGLFDYLSDRISQKLITCFYELIREGGHIYVGNVSKQNPDEFSMDFFMEWHLILRDAEDLLALAPQTSQKKVISESTGLNLFLEVEK